MDIKVNELVKEYNLLGQTQQMYINTLNEMQKKGAKNNNIASIKDEIDNISKKMSYLDKTIREYQLDYNNNQCYFCQDKEKQEENRIPVKKRKNKQKIVTDNTIPLNAEPVRINHFIVNFPSKYDIEPYMVESYVQCADNIVSITLREFERETCPLPCEFSVMKSDKFNINVQVLKTNGDVYYNIEYFDCKLDFDNIIYPINSYDNSNIRTYTLSFKFSEAHYDEATNKEEQ